MSHNFPSGPATCARNQWRRPSLVHGKVCVESALEMGGGWRDILAVFNPMQCSACGSGYVGGKLKLIARRRTQHVSRMDDARVRMRRHFEKPVVGSCHIDKNVTGADAVENRGRGELRCVHNSRRAADGAGLIERLHGAVIVAAADSCEPAAAIEFLIPEGKLGDAVLFVAAVHGFNAGEQMHIDRRLRRPSAAQADFAARRQRVIDRGDGANARRARAAACSHRERFSRRGGSR